VSGLIRQVVIASGLLAILLSAAFMTPLVSVSRTQEEVAATAERASPAPATGDQWVVVTTAGWPADAAIGGLAASAILVAALSGYLMRAITRPVGRAADMADRLADGDLSARVPETATGEIRRLERAMNAMARSLERRNEERVALRRVATIAAHSAPPLVVCNAVAQELVRVLDIDGARMFRYEPGGQVTVVATCSSVEGEMPVGSRWAVEGHNIVAMVARTGEPARLDDYTNGSGPITAFLREHGIGSAVGAPIIVDDRLWGVLVGFRVRGKPLARETEARIGELTELVATVIANAQGRVELAASRARLVAAADQARIRIERDLHDGIQQRLVSLALNLRAAEESVPAALPELRALLSAVTEGLAGALTDLQETSRGIYPAILAKGGLSPAVKALARRSAVPVELELFIGTRLGESIEVTAYYVVAEALANAAKHAKASVVHIEAEVRDDWLHLLVRDDGMGGADPAHGSGLTGLIDRVEAAGGTVKITSPVHQGTSLQVSLPSRARPAVLL
jgi:signal transduction histidine kinase